MPARAEFTVEASVFNPSSESSVNLELESGLVLVEGTHSQPLRHGRTNATWRVKVDDGAAPGRSRYSVDHRSCEGRAASSVSRTVVMIVSGRTGFDPTDDGFVFSNKPDLFGSSRPPRSVFDRTFRGGVDLFQPRFFDGLYQSVFETGLCTGMARAALWFATVEGAGRVADRTTDDVETREIIQLLHGRQLTDRALLSSAYALLTSGPCKVFRKFREQVLIAERSPIAIDVGIPKVTRSDFLRAVVRQGHTVVPYAYQLLPDNLVRIDVYDPVFPPGRQSGQRLAIEIDLNKNRHRYRAWSSEEAANPTTILGVPLSAYTEGSTAYIAGLVSIAGLS